jgi:hypothetical protein
MSNQGTAGKQKCVAIMIPQKHEIIRWLKGAKVEESFGFIQHWIVNRWCREMERPAMIMEGIKSRCERLFQVTGTEWAKIIALDKVLVWGL